MKTFIIAEIGVNHNGDVKTAEKLIDKACECGVDCVKFQTFRSENLVSKKAKKADYQIENTGNDDSQLSMLKKLELDFSDFSALKNYCDNKGIMFLSTPFDNESIDFLSTLDMPVWKIPSGEITDYPYLKKLAQTGKQIILSTGMCTLNEVADAIKVLKENGSKDITILHCTTEYPTPYNEVNLNAIKTLQNEFGLPVGYSDHTRGTVIPVAAVALGVTVIEKHFTLDRNMSGPDHRASCEPHEMKQMVEAIRNIEAAMGDGIKVPSESEIKNIEIVRKSIVAARDISKGEMLSTNNLAVKRPADGISPMLWEEVLGKKAKCDFCKDDKIIL